MIVQGKYLQLSDFYEQVRDLLELGKNYEFRLKGSMSQYESYVQQFSTSGKWETIKLEINKFYPQFRGRKINNPNFNFASIEQMSFLVANKQDENFELLIDWIGLE